MIIYYSYHSYMYAHTHTFTHTHTVTHTHTHTHTHYSYALSFTIVKKLNVPTFSFSIFKSTHPDGMRLLPIVGTYYTI